MLDQLTVETIVEREIKALLMESTDEDVPLSKQERLHELGLHSLLLARLVVQLDTVLEVEPFATGAVIADVRTVGDLVAIYEQASIQVQATK